MQCQAIIKTSAGLLSIGLLGTNFSEILIETQNFSLKKMHLKTSSVKWRLFCPGGDELIYEQGHPSIEAAIQIAVAFMSFSTANATVCGITHSIYIYM